ncbi:hypothetical protein [Thalassospira alkalitolerans]|uniref:Restriction endonuclease type IV Mrr domain-containing protein n=1 Tax=Thalassospira alkalitolerans TaxID=1293890 RepID=A0A1Y2LCE5_9PROT|nr:hypothetical protein [Thalassospira alkalitolerans]OSQ48083.1 hypothetical protein TALK_10915 [Thalassospira alkalitolerans]
MARFSSVFHLSNSQAELDFVDIELNGDVPLYLDPYAIQIREDEWSEVCGDHIRSFFDEVLQGLRAGNDEQVVHLLSHLGEPNETHLGQSKGSPRGRGFGTEKAKKLAGALRNSRAFETGLLADVAEAELFIHGVGPDLISDLTTNVLRQPLATYTLNQCELHDVETVQVSSLPPCWNPVTCRWESRALNLPVYQGLPILLVPKFSVRQRLCLDGQEFYNFHMIEHLRAEYLEAGAGIVHFFKDGRPHVFKKDVKERHPFVKDALAEFVRDNPNVLELYKQVKGAEGALSATDFDAAFDEREFARELPRVLAGIPTGNNDADVYHNCVLGILTFLFYPNLINPIKEMAIHQGRKRLDIKYTNTGERGFFSSILQSPQTRALSVPVECKNYSTDINNPELDQLTGRFGHTRGFLGFLLCRSVNDRARLLQKCKDAALDGRGVIIILEDNDLNEMLHLVSIGSRRNISDFLQNKLDAVTH